MSADTTAILARIKEIQDTIANPTTGKLLRAYDNPPYTISAIDMPLFVTFVGALVSNTLVGSDGKMRDFLEARNYSMILYHSPYGTGIEGEHYGDLTPFYEIVYSKFGGMPHLGRLSGIEDAVIVSDSGMESLQRFMNQNYYGIKFTLQVKSHVYRRLAAGE
jgi:hypothetical protein